MEVEVIFYLQDGAPLKGGPGEAYRRRVQAQCLLLNELHSADPIAGQFANYNASYLSTWAQTARFAETLNTDTFEDIEDARMLRKPKVRLADTSLLEVPPLQNLANRLSA